VPAPSADGSAWQRKKRKGLPNGNRHFFLIRLASALPLASFFLKWGNLVAGFLGAPLPFSATAALLLVGR
jgi:hypothetical protein